MNRRDRSVGLDDETWSWLAERATIEDRSVSSVVRRAIDEYRERHSVEGQLRQLARGSGLVPSAADADDTESVP